MKNGDQGKKRGQKRKGTLGNANLKLEEDVQLYGTSYTSTMM